MPNNILNAGSKPPHVVNDITSKSVVLNRNAGYTPSSSGEADVFIGAYYIDSINGDDNNSGYTQSKAIKSIGALPELNDGEVIYLARNSVFYETIVLENDNITIADYGSGNKPIIDCSDQFNTWIYSGTANVWYVNISKETDNLNTWVNVYENGTPLKYRTSIANCSATAGTYYVTSHTASTATVYVHASTSNDPNTNGRIYRIPVRLHAIRGYAQTGTSLTNVVARRPLSTNGCCFLGYDNTITGCEFNDGNKHNLLIRGTSIISNTSFIDAYYNAVSASQLVLYTETANNETATLTNCVFTCTNDTAVGGFFCHIGIGGNFGTHTIENCEFTGNNVAITGSNFIGMNIESCEFTNCDISIRHQTTNEFNIIGCVCNHSSAAVFYQTSNGSGTGTVGNISGCTVSTQGTASGQVFIQNNNTVVNVDLCNFSMFGTFLSTAACITAQSGITGYSVSVNDCSMTGVAQTHRYLSVPTTFVADNNCYETIYGVFSGRWGATNYNSITTWKTDRNPQEQNSVYGC